MDLPQRLTRIAIVDALADLAHVDAHLGADPLDRLHEIQSEVLLHEAEHVARFAADEAFVSAAHGDREVGVFSVVERTRPAKAVADAFQLDELADYADDVGLVAHAVDDVVRNHARSATVTPAPPSFQAPSRKLFTRVSLRSISATRSRSAPVPFP